jgi:hypothetical protein
VKPPVIEERPPVIASLNWGATMTRESRSRGEAVARARQVEHLDAEIGIGLAGGGVESEPDLDDLVG